MFQQIRLRLALWYAAVTGVLLLLFALVFFAYVRFTLIDRVDDTISHIAEVLERSIVHDPTNREILFTEVPTLEADHIDLEWFDVDGNLQWSTLNRVLAVPLVQSLSFNTTYPIGSEPLRQFTRPIWTKGEILGYLRISHPWFEVTKPVKELSLELFMGVWLIVLVVAICGWWLAGIAMLPIQESYQQLKQFTADVSHELRNPLAVIQTNTQVALLQSDPRSYLEVIERLTKRMGKLLEDLLFLARTDRKLSTEPTEICNLVQLIEEVLEEQQIVAMQKFIELEIIGIGQPAFINGYPDQLLRLFTNLITNSIHFTPPQGRVEISIISSTNQTQISIKDTGPGIDDTNHIFDRYYRGRTSNGSGLGLAIVQAIIEHHRGKIRVDSKPNQGSNFIVTLPANV